MAQIRVRRGTTAEWVDANPVLAAGEPGFDVTTETFKVGNGVDQWTNLDEIKGAVVSVNGETGEVVLDAAAVGALPDDYVPAWSDVTGKPATFPPSSHNHDDRYYTESEVNNLLGAKANDNAVVKLSGVQTITGTKTFVSKIMASSGIVLGSPPAGENDATHKMYVDGQVATRAASSHSHTISDVVGLQDALDSVEGFTIVETVEDIPPGLPAGSVVLVMEADGPAPANGPQIVGTAVASSSSGTSLVVDVPDGVQNGDWALCFMTSQHDGTAPNPVWTSGDMDGWPMGNTSSPDLRTTAIGYRSMAASDEGGQLTFEFGAADQRRLVMVVLLRNVATFPFYVVGTPQGHNGVGTDDTTVPSVVSTASKALHLVFGWSNGSVGSSHVPDAPTVGGGMSVVAGAVEPPSPSSGFTTIRLWARVLEGGGPSGSVTLDWPLLAQRAGVAVAVLGREEEE